MATANLGITLPTVGGSTDTWGTTLNTGITAIDALFSVDGTDVTMSDVKFNSISVQETGAGTDTVKIQAPSAVTASYTLTMPAAVGTTNQVLSLADGTGTLAWSNPEVGDITGVTAGDGLTGGGTSGTVTLNVIGTADKITVSADAVTIASTYVGQSSITTLGTIGSLVATTADINGGTFDGVVGGTTPAAGSFTTLNATGGGALAGTWSNLGTVSAATSITSTAFVGPLTGNVTGDVTGSSGSTTGLAATATALATARAINGTSFDGTEAITITAAAGTLTGSTLASGVTASSLTSVGTLTSLVATTADINGGTVDGATVGASSASSGAFTTLAASSTLAVTGASTLTGNVTGTAVSTATWTVSHGATDGRVIIDGSSNGNGGALQLYGSAHATHPSHLVTAANTQLFKTVGGITILDLQSGAASVTGTLAVTGATTLSSTLAVTGTSTLTGLVGLGAAPQTTVGVTIGHTALTGTTQLGGSVETVFTSAATTLGVGFRVQPATVAGAYTMADMKSLLIGDAAVGGGGMTLTNLYGLYINSQTSGGTLNYAIYTNAGLVHFGGAVDMASTLAVTGASTLTGVVSTESATNVAPIQGVSSHATTPRGISSIFTGGAPNNGTQWFYYAADTSAARFVVYSNGGISNYQSNDADLSDERLKTVYQKTDSTWDAMKALEIVDYRYNDNLDSRLMMGVLAQQVEKVAPRLFSEKGWGDDKHHAVHNKDLWMTGLRTLQEAQHRIEDLTARLDAAGL